MDSFTEKAKNRLYAFIPWVPSVGILMILCTLPFPFGEWQRAALYIAVIGYGVDFACNRRWVGWRWSKEKMVFLLFILFYLLIPIRQIWDPAHTWLFSHKSETYLQFLILGLMGFLGFNHTLKLEHVTGVMTLTCLYMAIILAWRMRGLPFADFTTWNKTLNDMRIQWLNSHMAINAYCNMTLVFAGWTLLESSCRKGWKMVIGILSVGIILGILLSEGRTGQITLMVLLTTFIEVWLYKHRWFKWLVPSLMAMALCMGLLYHFSPRFQSPSTQDNPRLYVWKVGLDVAKEKPIAGWGVSSAREEFIKRGLENEEFKIRYLHEFEIISMKHFGEIRYQIIHPHNAFIETTMELGLIGTCIFLLCLILPVCLLPIGRLRWYLATCIFVFAMQGMFECMGSCLLPIWVPLMTFVWRYNNETKQTDEDSV